MAQTLARPSIWPREIHDHLERRRRGLEHALTRLEDLRETLVQRLDALTPDADLEPSLAGFGGQAGSGDDREADYSCGFGAEVSDIEPVCEDEGTQDGIREHSLGACENGPGGSHSWHSGSEEEEHSLGSLGGTATSGAGQSNWPDGKGWDYEEQCEDEGDRSDFEPDTPDISFSYISDHDQMRYATFVGTDHGAAAGGAS